MNLQKHKFREVSIFLNNQCNLRCHYCFVDDKYKEEMSPDTLFNTLEFINRYADQRGFHLHLFGTEPLLSWDLIKMILRWREGNAPHWGLGITSNMTKMTKATAGALIINNVSVLASLDGKEESHNRFRVFRNGRGSFKRTIKGIQNFADLGGQYGVAMTVTPENLPYLLENVQFVYNLNPKPNFIALNKVIDHWDSSYDSRILYKNLKSVAMWWIDIDPDYPLQFLHKGCHEFNRLQNGKMETSHKDRWTCGALWGSFGIRWDGTIFPCHRMVADGWEVGHISSDINPDWISYYRSLDATQCHLCPNFSCGTCYIHNYYNTGSIHQIPPTTCQFETIRNQLVREIHPLWLKRIVQKEKMITNEQSSQ